MRIINHYADITIDQNKLPQNFNQLFVHFFEENQSSAIFGIEYEAPAIRVQKELKDIPNHILEQSTIEVEFTIEYHPYGNALHGRDIKSAVLKTPDKEQHIKNNRKLETIMNAIISSELRHSNAITSEYLL